MHPAPADSPTAALDEAVALLAAIGAAAAADDAQGPAWAAWADHCWRAGHAPSPADPEELKAYAKFLDSAEEDALRAAIAKVESR
jgi:hypothetical protein